jgi:raffinose/stachyose/melibiose transport system permease protein
MVIPFIMGFDVAFSNWDGLSPAYDYVGLKNFRILFQISDFRKVLFNSFYFAILLTVLNNILSLTLALGLSRNFRGRSFARASFFFPTCLSTVLASFIWKYIYRDVFSQLFGVKSLLGSLTGVIPAIVFISLWNSVGVNILIYIAGLTNIPLELYEAARVDGASGWQRFRHITVPMLMPAFTVCITMTLIAGLKEFGTTMAATGGGPSGASTTLAIYIYNNLYTYYQAGYGQAVALVFMVMLLIIGTVLSRALRAREVEV